MTFREDRMAAELAARLASCPSVEELVAFRDKELAAEQRQRVARHLVGCDSCADALALLEAETAAEDELEQELPDDVEARSEQLIGAVTGRAPSRKGASRWWIGAAAAAVLVLAVLAVWQLRGRVAPTGPVLREAGIETIRSQITADSLPRDAFVLRWSIDGEVSHYNLLLARENLDELAEVRGLTEAEHIVDPALLEGIDSGAKLIWQVEAVRPGGMRVVSGTFVTSVE